MVNRVFNDRLERDLVAEVIEAALVNLEAIGKLILVAHGLNLQVALRVLHLAADGDELMTLADADAEQLRQRVYHHDRFLVLPPLAHPRNGVERVVEEMRVDLRLQGSELRFAEVHLFGAHGRHQLLDLPHHVRKRGRQILHLAHAGDWLIDKIVRIFLKLRHRRNQVMNRPGKNS